MLKNVKLGMLIFFINLSLMEFCLFGLLNEINFFPRVIFLFFILRDGKPKGHIITMGSQTG